MSEPEYTAYDYFGTFVVFILAVTWFNLVFLRETPQPRLSVQEITERSAWKTKYDPFGKRGRAEGKDWNH